MKKYFAKDFDYKKTQAVDQVAGSFFLVKAEVLKKLKGLDEGFFLWFEEVDFCKRVHEMGMKVYYFSQSTIIHHGAQSFSQVMPLENKVQFFSSMKYYFKKHHGLLAVFILSVVKYPSYALSWVQNLFSQRS